VKELMSELQGIPYVAESTLPREVLAHEKLATQPELTV
jgi:hypothetical protein